MLELMVRSTGAAAESATVKVRVDVPKPSEPPEMMAPPLSLLVLATVVTAPPRVILPPMLSVGVAPVAELLAPKVSAPAPLPKVAPLPKASVPSLIIVAPV